MARPLSPEKRTSILAAAVDTIAELGLSAPTAKIASTAGLAEGTLFTYFKTKDELLNQLYLELKQELAGAISGPGPDKTPAGHWRFVWDRYVDWGVNNPSKRNALRQLCISDKITSASVEAAEQVTDDITGALFKGIQTGLLRKQPPEFIAAIFEALGEMTIDCIVREPKKRARLKHAGFEALWNAISAK